jgi:ribosomal protein S18 acetylase RimI-like enzyme
MTRDGETPFDKTRVLLRQAADDDLPVLSELFEMGVLEGQVPDNDTGADIENFCEAYGSDGGMSGFWVAVYEGAIVGMVGVQRHDNNVAEIRRLRVRPDLRRRGIGSMLMERAIAFCRERDYLKVILDTRVEEEPAIRIFKKFGFQLGRTREIDGRRLIDFYLDMYREPEIKE